MRLSRVRWLVLASGISLVVPACSREEARPSTPLSYAGTAAPAEPERLPERGFLDPNLATAAALTELPGMSDSLALAVIRGRPYGSMPALDRVLARYMASAWRDSVYTRLWIPLDLNTASSDEIALIPGVDSRLRQELEEYRPYEGLEEFRRDIGTRLGPEETARLERYIILP